MDPFEEVTVHSIFRALKFSKKIGLTDEPVDGGLTFPQMWLD